MGRLTLMLVMAAAISGAVFTISTRGAMSDADRAHAEGQADVLAREIAEAGQSVALTQMVGSDGFLDPTARLDAEQAYEGGKFRIEYTPVAAAAGAPVREATVRVTGTFGGAVHTVESEYEFDPMNAPGPLWLDVPHVVSTISGRPNISGSQTDHPIHLDTRKHAALELEGLVPLAELRANAAAIATAGSSGLETEAQWTGPDGILEDLDLDNQLSDAEGLYQQALMSMNDDDQALEGQTVAGTETWGRRAQGDDITHIDGDLIITGTVEGHGALLINGALRVPAGGELDWEGLVIVRSEENVLPIDLLGRVTIKGMMVVAHQAFAPGGHLDVSVYHAGGAPITRAEPWGDFAYQVSPWSPRASTNPFVQHTHAFDITPTRDPRGDQVVFLEDGNRGKHSAETQFKALLDRLDPDELIQLSFGNPDEHGFSTFGLDIEGEDEMKRGTVQRGFGSFAQASRSTLSKPFRVRDLRDLDIDVRSLRALRQSFDDDACSSYPVCIGRDYDRLGSMALRVLRASDGERLYEASFYWHMRQDEEAAHEAEEAAWRARIAAGEAFGTTLAMNENVTLTFDIGEISELADKLLFDGNEVVLLSSRSNHVTAAEDRATEGGSGDQVQVCHKPGTPAEQEKMLDPADLADHLGHGDTRGACSTDDDGIPPDGAPIPTEPLDTDVRKVWICHYNNGNGYGSVEINVNAILTHVLHLADYMGQCQ